MMRFRHLGRLLLELTYYSVVNRRLWPLAFVSLLLLATFASVTTHFVSPFIYTIF